MKRCISHVSILLAAAAAFAMASCEQTALSPSGPFAPGGGLPGGGDYVARSSVPPFDIDNLPSVDDWNDYGEIVAMPNPFVKADGTEIATEAEWPERRAEIRKILEYYYCGTYPSQPSGVEISDAGAAGSGNHVITVNGNGRSTSFSGTLTVPATAPNGQPVSATNKAPLVILVGANGAAFPPNGYATITFSTNTVNPYGIVRDIWPYSDLDPSRPSALLQDAWKAARIIDAVEAGAGGGVLDADKILATGASRNGKDALYMGAFAESMTGKRIAVTDPAVTCAGGMPIERFVSTTTTKKSYYYIDMGNTYGGTPFARVVAPGTAGSTWRNLRNGIQTNIHGRQEQAEWYGRRFQGFIDTHPGWNTNLYHEATSFGLAGTTPFDSHFLAALVAPRGLVTHDVWEDIWSNAEGVYMSYLATKEVYDFLGADQNIGFRFYDVGHSMPTRDMYDIVDFANMYFNRTAGTDYVRLEGQATYPPITDNALFQDKDPLYYSASAEPDPEHAVTWYDPRSRDPSGVMEYTKLNWASPKKPAGSSVAAKVKAHFDAHPGEALPGSIFLPEQQ
jgi:endo-1,4-beta-xylanase